MSDTDQRQAHLAEHTEARLHTTGNMLREADARLREARVRHQTADSLFASARDLSDHAQANLNRAVTIRRRLNKLDMLVLLMLVLTLTHII